MHGGDMHNAHGVLQLTVSIAVQESIMVSSYS